MLYRLPREAEWEYACRAAGTSQADCSWDYYVHSPTNTLSPQQANFKDSALERTSPVGSYEPNALGIYDMHGNVWEWCEDWYDASQKARVLRGGSWSVDSAYCRSAYRISYTPDYRYDYIGLRLVLSSR
jgi:formylglycine-generating enzyme required for sulfatase activity